MVKQFYQDLAKAQETEELVRKILAEKAPSIHFISVGNIQKYYHKGDIKAVDNNGKEYMIEVKDDSRIAQTGNVLCEEWVYYFETDTQEKGNMYSDYEYYCVVSQQDRKIYVIDFQFLKKYYRSFDSKQINHSAQITFAYLVPIGFIKRKGGLIAEIDY